MNLPVQLVAVDVDGTLLDGSHQLRANVKESLNQLASFDVKIVLATARGPQALGLIVRQLSFSPLLICFSGGWIGELDSQSLLPTNVLLDKRLTPSVARVIVTAALAHKIEPNIYTPTEWRGRAFFPQKRAWGSGLLVPPFFSSSLFWGDEKTSKNILIFWGDPP